jgi:hypothetical protein
MEQSAFDHQQRNTTITNIPNSARLIQCILSRLDRSSLTQLSSAKAREMASISSGDIATQSNAKVVNASYDDKHTYLSRLSISTPT